MNITKNDKEIISRFTDLITEYWGECTNDELRADFDITDAKARYMNTDTYDRLEIEDEIINVAINHELDTIYYDLNGEQGRFSIICKLK